MSTQPERVFLRMSLAAVLAVCLAHRPAPAMTVFDPSNFAQNVLQAGRALQQVQNQIRSLQNEAEMLINMALNLKQLDISSLDQVASALRRIDVLMRQAEGIAYGVEETAAAIDLQFPTDFRRAVAMDTAVAEALERWHSAINAYRQTMSVQAQIVANVQEDSGTLATLLAASDAAVGALQAQQATNQLMALSTKQQLQIQNLMAAQFRAVAVDQARKIEAEQAAQAATQRFLGSGKIYTP